MSEKLEMTPSGKTQLVSILRNALKEMMQNYPTASLAELVKKASLYLEENVNQQDLVIGEELQRLLTDYDLFRNTFLQANNINEFDYYTKDVDTKLKAYVEEFIFPQYEKNDKAHGLVHIKEVIRRSFELNQNLKLQLDPNILYAVAAYHDLGKYIDHETHEKIAARLFYEDEHTAEFFDSNTRELIKEAIEDHRSSFHDMPRSDYGKLISSADRNTRIETVFIRSFFVGKWRTPEMPIEEFLDFTFHRLEKRYSIENPENMFYEDDTYRNFLKDMRTLLTDEVEFKNRYCQVNHISSRDSILVEEPKQLIKTT